MYDLASTTLTLALIENTYNIVKINIGYISPNFGHTTVQYA